MKNISPESGYRMSDPLNVIMERNIAVKSIQVHQKKKKVKSIQIAPWLSLECDHIYVIGGKVKNIK